MIFIPQVKTQIRGAIRCNLKNLLCSWLIWMRRLEYVKNNVKLCFPPKEVRPKFKFPKTALPRVKDDSVFAQQNGGLKKIY